MSSQLTAGTGALPALSLLLPQAEQLREAVLSPKQQPGCPHPFLDVPALPDPTTAGPPWQDRRELQGEPPPAQRGV